jgi:hypothetical protein
LLGLPTTAKPAMVKEAYEDAIEDKVDGADVLMRAQQTLLTPRFRIEAEVGGFLDVAPALAAEIVSGIVLAFLLKKSKRTSASFTRCRGRTSSLTTVRRDRWHWIVFAI